MGKLGAGDGSLGDFYLSLRAFSMIFNVLSKESIEKNGLSALKY